MGFSYRISFLLVFSCDCVGVTSSVTAVRFLILVTLPGHNPKVDMLGYY